MRILGVSVLLIALSACGGGDSAQEPSEPASSSGPPEAVRYSTVVELRDAAVEAGYACPNWTRYNVATAASSGACTDADVFAVYATDASLEEQVDIYKGMGDLAGPVLVGPNWTINGPPSRRLAKSLGGTIVP